MRTLKLQTQVSLDGYLAGPNGEMDWMSGDWSDDVGTAIAVEALTRFECGIVGTKLVPVPA